MNERDMLTAVEVLDRARRLGAPIALQTFWKHIRIGLLPKGRKIRGRGNCTYFPADTPKRVLMIRALQEKGLALAMLVGVVKDLRSKPRTETLEGFGFMARFSVALAQDRDLSNVELSEVGRPAKKRSRGDRTDKGKRKTARARS